MRYLHFLLFMFAKKTSNKKVETTTSIKQKGKMLPQLHLLMLSKQKFRWNKGTLGRSDICQFSIDYVLSPEKTEWKTISNTAHVDEKKIYSASEVIYTILISVMIRLSVQRDVTFFFNFSF